MSRNYSVPSSSISKDRKSSNNASEVEDVDQRTDLQASEIKTRWHWYSYLSMQSSTSRY